MASNGFKPDPGYVKDEPGMDDMDMADIDDVGGYEDDTGELIFPKALGSGWLLRVPKELWNILSQIDEDQEIQIGEIRQWDDTDAKGKKNEIVRFHLAPQLPGKDLKLVPKQYDLTSSVTDPKNTFVFSEKNLPGFKPRQNRAGSQDLLKGIDSREGPVKIEKQRGPRTIPKRTEYLGKLMKEFSCTPRDNQEYRHIEQLKRSKENQARTTFIRDEQAATKLHNDGMLVGNNDLTFIQQQQKKRPQDNKATRMERFELLDALSQCFKEYKFWPMSSLKQRLKQPEAWLKEVLGDIAILVRTGHAANTYTLLPQNQVEGVDFEDVKEEDMAPKEEDADDDDVEFEDVPPTIIVSSPPDRIESPRPKKPAQTQDWFKYQYTEDFKGYANELSKALDSRDEGAEERWDRS